jgi:hypothetical protein
MLFQRRFHERIRSGEIRRTVRVWHRPRVKVGGRYALDAGAIVVQRIHETRFEDVTPELARTEATLRVISARPGVLAAKLARSLGRPRDEFNRDVRKLKNLGLTFSLEIGYRLTPKGEALLRRE